MPKPNATPHDKAAAWQLSRLELHNVRCFDHAAIELHRRLTVFVGENGSGKSTVVEAIAALAWRSEDEDPEEGDLQQFPGRAGGGGGEIVLHRAGARAAGWLQAQGAGRDRLPEQPWLLAYGRYRGIALPPAKSEAGELVSPSSYASNSVAFGGRAASVFAPSDGPTRNMTSMLLSLHARGREGDPAAQQRLDALHQSLRKVVQGFDQTTVAADQRGLDVHFDDGSTRRFGELSDGYKAVLALVADALGRLATGVISYGWSGDQLTLLIDEVDLHLHPRWQHAVLDQLLTAFPGAQLVVTTHSAQVALAAVDIAVGEGPGCAVYRMVPPQAEKAARVERLAPATLAKLHHAAVGSALVETELFGLDSAYSHAVAELERELDALVAKAARSEKQRARLRELLDKLQGIRAREAMRQGQADGRDRVEGATQAVIRELLAALAKVGAQ
ncbi:MAG: AAA family ATPase [Deltaproteobacteria bacterium]|nr:AAA family ATPase [Deltaproteobacteria bacterium]